MEPSRTGLSWGGQGGGHRLGTGRLLYVLLAQASSEAFVLLCCGARDPLPCVRFYTRLALSLGPREMAQGPADLCRASVGGGWRLTLGTKQVLDRLVWLP